MMTRTNQALSLASVGARRSLRLQLPSPRTLPVPHQGPRAGEEGTGMLIAPEEETALEAMADSTNCMEINPLEPMLPDLESSSHQRTIPRPLLSSLPMLEPQRSLRPWRPLLLGRHLPLPPPQHQSLRWKLTQPPYRQSLQLGLRWPMITLQLRLPRHWPRLRSSSPSRHPHPRLCREWALRLQLA